MRCVTALSLSPCGQKSLFAASDNGEVTSSTANACRGLVDLLLQALQWRLQTVTAMAIAKSVTGRGFASPRDDQSPSAFFEIIFHLYFYRSDL